MAISVDSLRNAIHLKAEINASKLGVSEAEVCFLGRSNVGKSSVINLLCSKRDMARASQIPGKTRTINVYEAVPGRWLIDLPGYGFAMGGRKAKDQLGGIIEGYLKDRTTLAMVYVLVDAFVGPTTLDRKMIDWLAYYDFPFSIVVNKIDKIAQPKLDARKNEIVQALKVGERAIFWVSTTKKLGVLDLQHSVVEHLS
ncbi:MAG: ribosome biogenesis GTP-binding protein YsxC [Candidatus Omnitrophica bacterium]|nr:ribosome biogenesis GTP-binding protein YsxC [Candidatus Omnitrophota bacterium]